MKTLFKVIKQLEPFSVTKSDGSSLSKSCANESNESSLSLPSAAKTRQFVKCQIVLQEIGGKYENSYVATLLGQPTPNRGQSSSLELPRCEGGKDAKQINAALCKFYEGDLVFASLSFKHSEYQGKYYQDITVQDIISFTNHQ